MNDSSGETPNPLNPTPASGMGNGQATTLTAVEPTNNAGAPGPVDVNQAAPTAKENPAIPAEPSIAPEGSSSTFSGNTEQKAESTQPPKKSKLGPIIGIVVACLLLIGGVVLAIVMMGMNRGDAVSAAMQKIMSGEAPDKVAIDGDINILLNDEASPIKRININLDSDIMVGSMLNTSSAVVTFTDANNKDYSMKFEEIYAAGNNLYLKIEGAVKALQDSGLLNLLSGGQGTNCVTDATGATNCMSPSVVGVDCTGDTDCVETDGEIITQNEQVNNELANAIINVINSVDGIYLRISSEDLNLVGTSPVDSSQLSCITNLVSNTNKNSNGTIQLYNKYPFILSTDKNIQIASKQNPIYQVSVDNKKFANFVNEIQNDEITGELYSCLGLQDNLTITEEDIAELTSKMPKVYAEVNSDNNFTRLYLESELNDGAATAVIDLGFSYPTNVNVSEPVEYKDFRDFIQTIFNGM